MSESDANDVALQVLREIEFNEAQLEGDLHESRDLKQSVLDHVQQTEPAFRVGNPTAIPEFRKDAHHFTEEDEQRFATMANAWRGPRARPGQSQYKGRTRTRARSRPRVQQRRYRRNPYKNYARRYTKYYFRRPYMQNSRYRRYGRYTPRYRRR